MIKCAIFDLDGTLLDTLTTIAYYLNVKLKEYSYPTLDLEECRRCVGAGALKLVQNVLIPRGADEETISKFHKEYTELYDTAPTYLTEPYGGIVELIDELSSRGIKCAVLSNKPDFATRSLINRYFGDKFSVVHGGREGVPLKPQPEGVFDILSELGCDVSECAYVGDSDIDVYTFLKSRVALGIAVTWGFRTRGELSAAGATVFADTPFEVLDLISKQ